MIAKSQKISDGYFDIDSAEFSFMFDGAVLQVHRRRFIPAAADSKSQGNQTYSFQ
jgi:hypothetical protein